MSEWFFRRLNWVAGCLAAAVLFGLVAFAANIEIKDMDLWLHLAAGKHIIQYLSVPKADFLSCTITGTSWVNHEWLFQALVYPVYHAFGVEGLISLRAGVVFLTFALLFFLGYTRGRLFGPVAVLILVLLVYQLRMTLRPDVFSLLFFALYVVILGAHLDKRWPLWVIVLIQIVWTNTHGFFVLGPVVVLAALAGEWAKRRVRLPFEWNDIGRLSEAEYRRLKLMLPVVMLACLVNPYFVKGALYPFGVFFSSGGESKIFFDQIQELQRPFGWHTLWSWQPYFPYRLLILISALSFVCNRRKIDVSALLLWFIFLLFSLSALRNIVFFAFAAYFAFLANFQYVSVPEFLPPRCRNVKFLSGCSVILSAVLIVWMLDYGGRLSLRGYYDFDRFERKSEYGGVSLRNFPRKAADFLIVNNIQGNFFNDFNSGAYLLGRVSPGVKVFIDGRTEVYGAEFYKMYRDIWEGDTGLFDEAADRYRLTGAFLNSVYVPAPARTIRHLYDNPEWVLVYFDYDAAVFLRDIPANRRWIDRYRMDLTQWRTPDADLLKIGTQKVEPYRHVNRAYALFNMGFPEKAEAEAAEALRVEPYNPQAHKLLGRIYNERGEFAEAFESLRKAKLLAPDDMKVRYQIAVALYHLGETGKAEEQCRRVLATNPKNAEGLFLLSLIYAKKHMYDEMRETLRAAGRSAPDEVEGILRVGDLLVEQKEFPRAREIYGMILEADPENIEVKKRLNTMPQ